jgi:hypothetical protein
MKRRVQFLICSIVTEKKTLVFGAEAVRNDNPRFLVSI